MPCGIRRGLQAKGRSEKHRPRTKRSKYSTERKIAKNIRKK